MEVLFEKYNIVVDVPDGAILYKKDDAAKVSQLSKDATGHCQIILGDQENKSITSISFIGKVDTKEDYKEVIDIFAEQNIGIGIKLDNRERLEFNDGKALEVLEFTSRKNRVIAIFACIKRQVFMSNTNCKIEDFDTAKHFAIGLMKTIAPAQ